MKKTLITAVALAACAGTQLFAQNAKEGVITFALTLDQQSSISTSSTLANQGLWSQGPQYYKGVLSKRATADVIQSIAYVLHQNAGYYSSKAQLVLVQGELGGFFNLGATLGGANAIDPETDLAQGNNNDGFAAPATSFASTIDNINARLATGRHFRPGPFIGLWPPGHHQPWGQIFIKDPGKSGYSVTAPLCENVTFFFAITVQECYDCFYLSSFVTDSKFTYQKGGSVGPPCCTTPVNLAGSGKDRYYMTLTFDNTKNNPYLNDWNDAWIGNIGSKWDGVVGIEGFDMPGDGIIPDLLAYDDVIASGAGTFNRYVMRFTLNGVLTYTWALKRINTSDVVLDFVGSASYPANGYGFVSLACSLITGSVSIVEKIAKNANCCLDLPWYSSWYGVGWNLFQDQGPLVPTPAGNEWYFGSPVNTANDLSLHIGFNEWYEARWQWPQTLPDGDVPAQPESVLLTDIDSAYTPAQIHTHVPSARGFTDRANTDWPVTSTK
ncbi:MAG: hypothetical protein WCT12_19425 [Verrucomicrobiota bacterium]